MRKQQCLIHIYGDGEQSVLALDRLCVLEKVEWWYVDEREVGHVCAQFDEETMVEHLLLWALYFQVEVVMAYIDGDSPRGCKFRNYADSRVPAGAHEACVHVLRHPELWKEEQEKGRKWLKRRLACVLSFAMELVVFAGNVSLEPSSRFDVADALAHQLLRIQCGRKDKRWRQFSSFLVSVAGSGREDVVAPRVNAMGKAYQELDCFVAPEEMDRCVGILKKRGFTGD